MHTLDRNPLPEAHLRAERANDCCVACGCTTTGMLCSACQSILNYHPQGKRQPKLLDHDEHELMARMQKQLSECDDKVEVQAVIDFLVEVGRERFRTQRSRINWSMVAKDFQCEVCNRPINHKGKCLSCNRLSVSGCREG